MITIERAFTLTCPVDKVFAYLSAVEHGPSYTAGQRETHMTSTGAMGRGATFEISGTFLHGRATYEVTDYEMDRRLAWHSTSGVQTTTTWGLQQFGAGTRVSFTYTRQPSGHGWLRLPEWLQQERANERADRDLWALKELLAPSNRKAKTWDYKPQSVSRD
jgi:uncharacterized protein YndB with AHSA1/START domain